MTQTDHCWNCGEKFSLRGVTGATSMFCQECYDEFKVIDNNSWKKIGASWLVRDRGFVMAVRVIAEEYFGYKTAYAEHEQRLFVFKKRT